VHTKLGAPENASEAAHSKCKDPIK
jgi:hypothetical protein